MTSHIYNVETARQISQAIFQKYYPEFMKLRGRLKNLKGENDMTNLFGLKKETIEKIKCVLERYPQVEKAIIYGSRAMGNYRNGSDIDLTLIGGKELTHQVLCRILDEIDDLLLPYTFDVSLFHHISDSEVMDHIQRAGKVFYEKATEKTYRA